MAENTKKASRLLPPQVYPDGLDEARLDAIDAGLREKIAAGAVPAEPGTWLDREGDPWVLGADGSWTDATGKSRSVEWAPLIALFGPWTRAPEERSSPL